MRRRQRKSLRQRSDHLTKISRSGGNRGQHPYLSKKDAAELAAKQSEKATAERAPKQSGRKRKAKNATAGHLPKKTGRARKVRDMDELDEA